MQFRKLLSKSKELIKRKINMKHTSESSITLTIKTEYRNGIFDGKTPANRAYQDYIIHDSIRYGIWVYLTQNSLNFDTYRDEEYKEDLISWLHSNFNNGGALSGLFVIKDIIFESKKDFDKYNRNEAVC